jgi:hypothetical protein
VPRVTSINFGPCNFLQSTALLAELVLSLFDEFPRPYQTHVEYEIVLLTEQLPPIIVSFEVLRLTIGREGLLELWVVKNLELHVEVYLRNKILYIFHANIYFQYQ